MRIKPLNKQAKKNRKTSKAYHYWLVEEKPKAQGRLPQLNKHLKKMRKLEK
jgi:hypothetical protein